MATVFEKAKVRIIVNEPFYATLLFGMDVVETEVMPTGDPLWMAATDSKTLWVNPENMNALPIAKCIGTIKHELLHVALMHPFRIGHRTLARARKATDYVINDMIIDDGGELPDGVLYAPDAGYRDMAWEEVYNLLPEEPDNEHGEGHGGDCDCGDPFAHGDLIPAPDQSAEAQQEVLGRVIQAAQVARAMGKLPAFISEALGDLLNPRVSWEQELLEFMTEISRNDYSFSRPNRRFVYQDLYLPSLYSQNNMGNLCVVFDTSGSVSMQEMTRFASEAVGAVEGTLPVSLVVIYCDAQVQHVDYFDAPTVEDVTASLARYGCGGTHMPAALDWIDENVDDVRATIVFTDGYTDFGPEREYPVLWGITSKEVSAAMGRTVHVEA